MAKYQVYVGNVGQTIDTDNGFKAWAEYRRAIGDSCADYGRASGESVVLFRDGEPCAEYYGSHDSEIGSI